MTEPRRLLDEASGLDRAVLESAADDDPSPARRRRIVAALGITSMAVSSSAAAAGGVASWKIAVGIAAITSLGVGGAIVRAQHSPARVTPNDPRPVPVVVATARPVPSASVMPSAAPLAPVVSAAPMPQVDPPPPSPIVTTARPAPRKSVHDTVELSSDATPSIAREIALIDRARTSIAKGTPKSALATLDEYDVAFPSGTLSLEASVLRIEALAAAGDHGGAAARARSFLERHPRSTYDARVRAHLTNP